MLWAFAVLLLALHTEAEGTVLVQFSPADCQENGCTAALNAAISSCAAAAPCTLTLDAGLYLLDGPPFGQRLLVNGVSNFALVGSGLQTILLLDDVASAVAVAGSSNVTIAGLALDSLRVPFTYGTVISSASSEARSTDVALASNAHPQRWRQPTGVGKAGGSVVTFNSSLFPINTGRYPWLQTIQGVLSYNATSQRVAYNATDIYALGPTLTAEYGPVEPAGLQQVSINTTLRVGDSVILRHQTYGYNSFSVYGGSDLTFRNVTLLSGAGMGIYTSNVGGRVLVNGLNIMKAPFVNYSAALEQQREALAAGKPSAAASRLLQSLMPAAATGLNASVALEMHRPMSLNADGLHFSNPTGASIAIRNSVFEGQGDDGINIPTIFQEVESISADRRTITVGRAGAATASTVATAGCVLNFFNRTNQAFLGTATVQTVNASGAVTFTAPLPQFVQRWTALNNAGLYASDVLLANNLFKANRARGALLKQSNVLAVNNTFDHPSGAAIKTETDACFWFEGHAVKNWTVHANVFIGTSFGPGTSNPPADVINDNFVPLFKGGAPTSTCIPVEDAAEPVQHDVAIVGNTFVQDQGQAAFFAFSSASVAVSNNTVNAALEPEFNFGGIACTSLQVGGNVCSGGPQPCTQSWT